MANYHVLFSFRLNGVGTGQNVFCFNVPSPEALLIGLTVKKNGKNSRARKVELYNSQYELIETFDCIKNCAIYLNTKLPTPKNLDHLRHMILKHSKEKTIYNNYYFQIQE